MLDVEGEARWLLRGIDGVPGARALAKKHLGEDAVRVVPRHALPVPAALAKVNGQLRIYLRSGMTRADERWNICHELAEWHLGELGYDEPDVEEVAETLAAALVAPREPFRRIALASRDLPQLAEAFTTTQTAVALRLAEARCVEAAAVVRPGLVRVRAPDGFVLPDERGLRRAAREGHAQLERHVLTDDRRRVALVAA
jgi:hypothetical protein